MKENSSDYKVIAPVVMVLLLAFIACSIYYLLVVLPPSLAIFAELLAIENKYPLIELLTSVLYPLLLLVSALLLVIHSIFVLLRKKSALLSISVIVFALSCIALSFYGVLMLLYEFGESVHWLVGIANIGLTLMLLPIIFDSFKPKQYLLSKILSLLVFLALFALVFIFFTDIIRTYGLDGFRNKLIHYYPMITPVIPLCITLIIAFCPKTFDSNIEEVQGQEQI